MKRAHLFADFMRSLINAAPIVPGNSLTFRVLYRFFWCGTNFCEEEFSTFPEAVAYIKELRKTARETRLRYHHIRVQAVEHHRGA
jgi:hypothetical protein